MIYRGRRRKLEDCVCLIYLLQVRLQQAASYHAPEHCMKGIRQTSGGEIWNRRTAVGVVALGMVWLLWFDVWLLERKVGELSGRFIQCP